MFVQRNAQDEIIGAFANPQPGYAEEYLSTGSPELQQFRAQQLARRS
jgi:hypothetical protein